MWIDLPKLSQWFLHLPLNLMQGTFFEKVESGLAGLLRIATKPSCNKHFAT